MPTSPRQIYDERLEARRLTVAHLTRLDRRCSVLRLASFAGGLALGWAAVARPEVAPAWLGVPVALFAAAALYQVRVVRRRARAERAVRFYERGIARIDGRWQGQGPAGERFSDRDHPYSADLDLFGRGSLFQLLCEARTTLGQETLADWLRAPAVSATVRERQAAVEELRGQLDLREELAVLGGELDSEVDPATLIAWSARPRVLRVRWPRAVCLLLGVANVVTLVLVLWPVLVRGWIPDDLLAWARPFLAAGWVSALAGFFLRARVNAVLAAVDRPERGLEALSRLLGVFERRSFSSPRLARLRASLDGEQAPSRRVARLARLVEINASRHNPLFAPFAALTFTGTQVAYAVERWRSMSGSRVGRWLETLGELEALSSLAAYAFENPSDPFPRILEDGGPALEAREIGHPLLDRERAVTNDVRLGSEPRLLLVSGSNMSGKSTLLRTVGVNVVLAFAGAPVRAANLAVSPLMVGACMRVEDSLQEGLSHFYAEIRRLRAIVDLARGPVPLLFLLDEILHGTNSHDRRIGAEAVIKELLERGAAGFVTTHDLALAEIADALGPRAANVHFEDQLDGSVIRFDYRLRPGVVARGNALGLMRAVGLDV